MEINESRIRQLVEEKITGTDIFIVLVKMSAGKILVYLDKPEGITIGECSQIGRQLINDIEDSGIMENHEMEVSSPGMEEPLLVMQQYQRRIGREVHITNLDGSEKTGVLLKADENEVLIEESIISKEKKKKIVETKQVTLPFSNIKETKVVLSFKNK